MRLLCILYHNSVLSVAYSDSVVLAVVILYCDLEVGCLSQTELLGTYWSTRGVIFMQLVLGNKIIIDFSADLQRKISHLNHRLRPTQPQVWNVIYFHN